MIIHLHPVNPEIRRLKKISEDLKEGAVYIFPTDTVYAFITDSASLKGVQKIFSLREISNRKPLTILCPDISTASEYIDSLPNEAFRLMKRITPGPFTFIFRANKKLHRASVAHHREKQIGIRIPDNSYLLELMRIHQNPLTSVSVFANDEYMIDADDLEEKYGNQVSGIIEGGIVEVKKSSLLDFTTGELSILREGDDIGNLLQKA